MKLTASREEILGPVQHVIGVVERRQTMPVLSNVLLSARNNRLSVTGTDLEVELVSSVALKVQSAGDITVPGRKFLDILRSLAEGSSVTLAVEGDRLVIRAGRSRFTLSTLPAAEFPVVEDVNAQQVLKLPQAEFRKLIDKVHFSMAQQDVRYYLNGMLLESEGGKVRAVATDGHRLALCEAVLKERVTGKQQVILPRKGVMELQRMLGSEGDVALEIGTNHVRCEIGDVRFTSKLID
ncbi:MAG: DNA polymerase III subunit beta, partial [Steroidobacteraceae bacterium]